MNIQEIRKQVGKENLEFMISEINKKIKNASFFEKLIGTAVGKIFERLPVYQEEIYKDNPEMKEFFEKEYDFYFAKLTDKLDVVKWVNIYGTPKEKNKELYSLLLKKKYFKKLDLPDYEEGLQILKTCFLALDDLSEKEKLDLQETLFLFSQAVKQTVISEMFSNMNAELIKVPDFVEMTGEMEKSLINLSKEERESVLKEMGEEFSGLIHAGRGIVEKELNEQIFKSKIFNIEKGINLEEVPANKI